MTYAGHRDQRWGCTSYAQHGDDFMLVNLFDLIGIGCPSYIDLGAHHPTNISNTRLLYERGSRGVNVEANPELIGAFQLERPEDVNLCTGVGPKAGTFPFYMRDGRSGLNTFDTEEAKAFPVSGSAIKMLSVTTLNAIVNEHRGGRFANILLCDIEGLDYDVLSMADFSASSPLVICVESRRGVATERMTYTLKTKGFAFYCRLGENAFYVHECVKERVMS